MAANEDGDSGRKARVTAVGTPRAAADALPLTIIRPSRGWRVIDLGELWHYRELVYFFAWRDVKVRYKQAALGAAWAILQPVLATAIFTVIFGRLTRMPSDGLPYEIFALAALVPWAYFSSGLTHAAASLVVNQNLVRKASFPRIALPIAPVVAGLVDFALAFAVLLALMLAYGIVPTVNIIWLPFLLLLAMVTALGFGLWFAALNARYRDVQHVVPFLMQIWLFATPIVYPSSILEEPWRTLYALNPIAGVVEGFRWALLDAAVPGGLPAPGGMIAISSIAAVIILLGGVLYFSRYDRSVADVV